LSFQEAVQLCSRPSGRTTMCCAARYCLALMRAGAALLRAQAMQV
jgi:hypothetical protein